MDEKIRQQLMAAQEAEVTEHHLYRKLARIADGDENKRILERIADDELRHHNALQKHTGHQARPNMRRVWGYYVLARTLGVSFALRLMEGKEDLAQKNYSSLAEHVPEVAELEKDEYQHEQKLISMLDDERLTYASSMVLGLNDALVELTGAMAGFTLALQNTRLIALVGLVTGIAASLSMAASEYLATRTEDADHKHPLKAAAYTGAAYVLAVVVLVAPFFLVDHHMTALSMTLAGALALIACFTYYISVARGTGFRRDFTLMASISMGVAALSFVIGLVMRMWLGVDV